MANNSKIVNADGTTRKLHQIWGKPTGTILAPMSAKAMLFDGSHPDRLQGVTVSDQDDFSFTDGASDKPFSICCWAKLDAPNSYGPFVAKLDFDTIAPGVSGTEWMFHQINGKFGLFMYDNNSANAGDIVWKYTSASVFTNNNTWHHVMATYDGRGGNFAARDGVKLYVDGQLHAGPFQIRNDITAEGNPGYQCMRPGLAKLTIGGTIDALENSTWVTQDNRLYEGEMADVVIFDKELSALEAEEVYNNGAVKDMTTFSAYSSVISWYRLGDADHVDTNGIKDSVSGYNGSITGGVKIINAKNLKSDYVLKTI